jgi:hypothetical protein
MAGQLLPREAALGQVPGGVCEAAQRGRDQQHLPALAGRGGAAQMAARHPARLQALPQGAAGPDLLGGGLSQRHRGPRLRDPDAAARRSSGAGPAPVPADPKAEPRAAGDAPRQPRTAGGCRVPRLRLARRRGLRGCRPTRLRGRRHGPGGLAFGRRGRRVPLLPASAGLLGGGAPALDRAVRFRGGCGSGGVCVSTALS